MSVKYRYKQGGDSVVLKHFYYSPSMEFTVEFKSLPYPIKGEVSLMLDSSDLHIVVDSAWHDNPNIENDIDADVINPYLLDNIEDILYAAIRENMKQFKYLYEL